MLLSATKFLPSSYGGIMTALCNPQDDSLDKSYFLVDHPEKYVFSIFQGMILRMWVLVMCRC